MAKIPFYVKALYDYTSEHGDDLNFSAGQRIEVTALEGEEWYHGNYVNSGGLRSEGLFPVNFVEQSEPEIPVRPVRPAFEDPIEASRPATLESHLNVSLTPAVETGRESKNNQEILDQVSTISTSPAKIPSNTISSPPVVTPKSSSFRDRIAAFNKVEQGPLKPLQPNPRAHASGFVKKPFVAPPPSGGAYTVLPSKPEPNVVTRQKQRGNAERAAPDIRVVETIDEIAPNIVANIEKDEAEKVPMSLKERKALLEEQQRLQTERHDATSRNDALSVSDSKINESHEYTQIPASSPTVHLDHVNDTEKESHAPPLPALMSRLSTEELGSHQEEQILTDDHGHSSLERQATESIDGYQARRSLDVAESHHQSQSTLGQGEEVDEEDLRRQRLRERMARLAGPQSGIAMPFNPFAPASIAKAPLIDHRSSDIQHSDSPPVSRARVPILPFGAKTSSNSRDTSAGPSTSYHEEKQNSNERTTETFAETHVAARVEELDDNHVIETKPEPTSSNSADIYSPGPGSESDDELSIRANHSFLECPHVTRVQLEDVTAATNEVDGPMQKSNLPTPQATSSNPHRNTAHKEVEEAQTSPVLAPSIISRPPPPPPPTGQPPVHQIPVNSPVRDLKARGVVEESGSEYEGDYDTDIASGHKHKDALKSSARDVNDGQQLATLEDTFERGNTDTSAMPDRSAPTTRPSGGNDRPPIPTAVFSQTSNVEYDPYNAVAYNRNNVRAPLDEVGSAKSPTIQDSSADDTETEHEERSFSKPIERPPPPPPPRQLSPPVHVSQHVQPDYESVTVAPGSSSTYNTSTSGLNAPRNIPTIRSSIDHVRASDESTTLATDLDLPTNMTWWTDRNPLPPVLRPRLGQDILWEAEEATLAKRGGRSSVSKDIYILYMDYSQTIITARYDPREPSEVTLEQRHQGPPIKLRQDQLESQWHRFGSVIGEAARSLANNKREGAQGDGLPQSLPLELMRTIPEVLLPVGIRAYGAVVYVNIANASTLQYDEIRSGDIVTLRNAKFEGHHGAIKQKYKQDFGSGHVGIVAEWDGTKRTIKAWEQGREKKGSIRSEKFRLGDLRSGEIKVWRVVGREWVGWDSSA